MEEQYFIILAVSLKVKYCTSVDKDICDTAIIKVQLSADGLIQNIVP